ncbi:hypothetical protein Rhe02_55700 [Rhizocola hellebori]|uniref:Uncharacterized protein n=1 Tax=Rhizocola hellebori TaxID=1392758 RepID=A0A8J3QAZ6_9ACTN|nr:hypothetical protein [Rhizocola hellebori]GIH07503.1 hypothetical protein Rhe02_55700 [Rhizocola hellebori]
MTPLTLAVATLSWSWGAAMPNAQQLTAELYYSGSWHAYPAYISQPANLVRDRKPGGTEPEPARTSLRLAGWINPESPLSPLYGAAGVNTPIRVKLSTDVRLTGEVTRWIPERTLGHSVGKGVAWTTVEVNSAFYRLGQGVDTARSPMYRSMIGTSAGDYVPHAYWPMEDGRDVTVFASAVAGQPGQPLIYGGVDAVQPAADSAMTGSLPVPLLPGDTYIEFSVPAYTDTGQWVAQVATRLTDTNADAGLIIYADDLIIQVQYGHGNLTVAAAPVSDPGALIFSNSDGVEADDIFLAACSLVVSSVDTGGGDVFTARLLSPTGATVGQTIDVNPGVYRSLSGQRILVASGGTDPIAAGHLGVFTDPAFNASTDGIEGARAMYGWKGELGGARALRVGREHGITVTVEGEDSTPMGPQPVAQFLGILADIERTDGGVAFEKRDGSAIYRTGRGRLNRSVALTLPYTSIAPSLQLVLGARDRRNDVTVKTPASSSMRVELASGALSVQPPPSGIGRIETTISVNPETDDALVDLGWWYLHTLTVEGVLYETVTVDLIAAPAIAAATAAVDVDDVILLTGLPADESLADVYLTVLGIVAERIEGASRSITFRCVRGDTYKCGVYGSDPIGSLYDSDTSTLATGYSATATSFSVASSDGTLWITGSGAPNFPIFWDIEGMRIQVDAISGATSPQTATVVRNVDGWDKALSSGAKVSLWDPARYAR